MFESLLRGKLAGRPSTPGSHELRWTELRRYREAFFHERHVWAASLPDVRGLRVRTYGTSGPTVVVLHGGPGAAGSTAPVARGLADSFRVLEPFQRGSGGEPLTVARHIEDLQSLIETRGGGKERPAVVGHSWGAMLALAHAAAHPESISSLVLIGCGTFDPESRRRMRAILDERTTGELRREIERLDVEVPDPDLRLRKLAELVRPLHFVDLIVEEPDGASGSGSGSEPERDSDEEVLDGRAHEETWNDMLRCQEAGIYPAAFAAIHAPVLMLHGRQDPHPGRRIRNVLRRYMPQLEYREWNRCGHYPWRERGVREEFFRALRRWLRETTRGVPE